MMIDYKKFPISQMRILLRFWDSLDKMGFAEGRDEGGSVKELYLKGLIEPAGKVKRRIRWKIIEGKLNEKDISSMRELVAPLYSGFEIIKWSDGFKLVPGSLNIVASFIAKKDNFVIGLAFRVGFMDWVAKQLKEEYLINNILKFIGSFLANGDLKSKEEYTFEYDSANSIFIQVNNPKWWIKST